MGTLERLLTGTIISCWICIIGYTICWRYQLKMNKNVISCLEDNLKAWKDYEKTRKRTAEVIEESYGNVAEGYKELGKTVIDLEAAIDSNYLEFGRDLANLSVLVGRNHKKSLHIIDKLNGNKNCCKEQSLRDSVQGVEADRPRRKYVRRNNASKNS